MIHGIEDRPYQIELFSKAIERNSLVVLPTGLGKTIIILYIVAYYLKQDSDSQIVICTPTKPLVAQITTTLQEHLNVAADQIIDVSGAIHPEKREPLYTNVRVIVGTPQTIDNDMTLNRLSLKRIKLLCLDEAHHATQNYAYVKILQGFRMENLSPRIVGFTATPGNSKEKILEVIDNLGCEQLLYKSPNDPDVKDFTSIHHPETVFVQLPEPYHIVLQELQNYVKKIVMEIRKLDIEISNPDYVTRSEALTIQKQVMTMMQQDASYGTLLNYTPNLIRALHLKEIIETQGFPQATSVIESWFSESKKKGKTLKEFLQIMNEKLFPTLKENPIPHPKVKKLIELLKEENLSGESKIIIFSNYRASISFLRERLTAAGYNCEIFVGQSSVRGKLKGMSQKEQLAVLERFKEGDLNLLLATSVGEEGLDVGNCDLVVFYDSVPSVIRSVQRTGRGRKKQSRVLRLITKGTKDESMYYAMKKREKKIDYLLRDELPAELRNHQKSHDVTDEKEQLATSDQGLLKHFLKEKDALMKDSEPPLENNEAKNPSITSSKDNLLIKRNEKSSHPDEGEPIPEDIPQLKENTVESPKFDQEKKNGSPDEVLVLVDSREAVSIVPRALKAEGASIKATNLQIGDYQISQRCIIERKSTTDFVDSLIDGRLFDQSVKKMSQIEKPIYIIEGTWQQVQRNVPLNNILAAVAALISGFNFTILSSQNAVETAKLIFYLAKREQRTEGKPLTPIHTTKSTDLNETQENMLAQVPGMNKAKAMAILGRFKTVKEIAMASEKDLMETAGIGKILAKRIVDIINHDYTR